MVLLSASLPGLQCSAFSRSRHTIRRRLL